MHRLVGLAGGDEVSGVRGEGGGLQWSCQAPDAVAVCGHWPPAQQCQVPHVLPGGGCGSQGAVRPEQRWEAGARAWESSSGS